MTGTVLILGASGRFGRSAAEAFWNAGWRVRAFDRKTDTLPDAALGADVIVNGWNPPYDKWAAELPALAREVVAAARASGATVIQPENIYVYGPASPEVLGLTTPHAARNPLGRLRIEMEETLRRSGVQVFILRAGDFIDTTASGNWLDRVIFGRLGKGQVVYPGNPAAPHAWAYLPDLARAAVALAERRETLGQYEDIPYPGYTLTGNDLTRLVAKATGQEVRLKRMSWLPLRLARPFWPMARGLLEMRYLWNMPHRIDGTRFDELLPGFRTASPDEAIAAYVKALTGSAPSTAPVPTNRNADAVRQEVSAAASP